MSEKIQQDIRISVQDLWKVFGPKPQAILDEEWVVEASRAEVQERTGHVIAVREVSFDVRVGEVFVVMGLSGSGKSTLIRCLIRLIEPTQGSIEIDGQNVVEYDQDQIIDLRRRKTGMIFQHYGLFPHRNVMDNVAYGLEVQGVGKESRYEIARQALARVGMQGWERAYPDECSGGMQQRVGIARALALDPQILLMDEPFSGLDPLIRRQMQDQLMKLQEQLQKTIVFITHDLLEALKLGDHIAILRDGVIIQQGTPEQIVMNPVDEYVREFVKDVSKARVMGVTSIMSDPKVVLDVSQNPDSAVKIMKAKQASSAFIVGAEGLLKGLVTVDQFTARGVTALLEVTLDSFGRVSPDTSVQDLLPLVAEHEHPIAVVDDEGHLLGEVDRSTVLDSLAESQAEQAN
ncbi:MAG: glycine betaine/L-proline ABC transporter ATP-binding protein [Anaerolineales bacterium]